VAQLGEQLDVGLHGAPGQQRRVLEDEADSPGATLRSTPDRATVPSANRLPTLLNANREGAKGHPPSGHPGEGEVDLRRVGQPLVGLDQLLVAHAEAAVLDLDHVAVRHRLAGP